MATARPVVSASDATTPGSPAWFTQLQRAASVRELAERLATRGDASATGIAGSSAAVLAGLLPEAMAAAGAPSPVLLVTAHVDEAEHAAATLLDLGVDAARLPALELTPGGGVDMELLGERYRTLARFAAAEGAGAGTGAGTGAGAGIAMSARDAVPRVLAAPIAGLMQLVPPPGGLDARFRSLRPGDEIDRAELADWLTAGGWRRVQTIDQPGDFSMRGDIIDVFPTSGEPCRLDCFGDEIERIFAVDLDSMGSDRALDGCDLLRDVAGGLVREEDAVTAVHWLAPETVVVLAETLEIQEQGRGYLERVADGGGIVPAREVLTDASARLRAILDLGQFSTPLVDPAVAIPVRPLPRFDEQAQAAVREVGELAAGGTRVVVAAQNDGEASRLRELLAEHAGAAGDDDGAPGPPRAGGAGSADGAPAADRIAVETRFVHRGFTWEEPGAAPVAVVPYHELMHRFGTRRSRVRTGTERALDAFVDMQPGDHVVHRDHGIAVFRGLTTLEDGPDAEEYLTLEFARNSTLHVPAAKIELVQKYVGGFSGTPELSTYGGRRWKNQKEKVAGAVQELAGEMLRLQAARAAMPGVRYPGDTTWQHEFEAEFPYPETDDQLAAIASVKRDMQHEQPMDRLICGDVGFGKTEIAIRAAFKACEYGKQVAVLVPTTVLAEQHERTFRARFRDYPFRVEAISRFRTGADAKDVLADLRAGRVDVIIGTHRLLSKDVVFNDLGLVVIDEEQRFGVEHKQRLLAFRTTADVMTLSATPIPRTLHMAMLGLRDISSLQTPPIDRRSVVTEVIPFDGERLRGAIARELAREGQVFYVHNRVQDIESVADEVRRLSPPGTRVIIGHGQMPPRQLEQVMLRFMRGEADVLVCTTIIESGIDIPTANTMIIDDADAYGLSQLHQLRGRVGRSRHRAYCYLLLPRNRAVNEVALKRLRALESFSMLGSGFRIALKDLELRGAGNLLGAEQSGHIAAVGYEMYCQLLEQAVSGLKGERTSRSIDTNVELGVTGILPRGYVPSEARRLDAYRRISRAASIEELERVAEALRSAYGDLPKRARVLFELAELRVHAADLGVRSIKRQPPDVVFRTAEPGRLETALQAAKGSKRLVGSPEGGLATLYYRPPETYLEPRTLLRVLRARLGEAASAVREAEGAGAADGGGAPAANGTAPALPDA